MTLNQKDHMIVFFGFVYKPTPQMTSVNMIAFHLLHWEVHVFFSHA